MPRLPHRTTPAMRLLPKFRWAHRNFAELSVIRNLKPAKIGGNYLAHMKILITGASSYVGARIYNDLKDKFEVIGTYHANKLFPELKQLDIRSKIDVENFVIKSKPDFIVHVAQMQVEAGANKTPNKRWQSINMAQKISLTPQTRQTLKLYLFHLWRLQTLRVSMAERKLKEKTML